MNKYKRLTERRGKLVIDNCGNCPNVSNPSGCTAEICHKIMRNRLTELEDKIETGTLIELPCRAGDTVYVDEDTWRGGIFFNHTYIDRKLFVIGKVTSVRITENQIQIRVKSNYQNNLHCYKTKRYPTGAIGRTIFLSKESAEARLKELQER